MAAPRVDDLNAVLGKFRVWNEMQGQPAEAKKPRQDPAREVSYEQALRSISRYRRPDLPAAQKESIAREQPESISVADAGTVPELQKLPSSATSRSASPAAKMAKVDPRRKAVSKRCGCKPAISPAEEKRSKTKTASPSIARHRQPSFGAAVKRELAIQKKERKSALEGTGQPRDTALTVRLTGQELDLIRSRAAEAKVSVSGYLRQCALEVEILRKHVEGVLAELRVAQQAADERRDKNEIRPKVEAPAQVMRRSLMDRFRSTLVRVFGASAGKQTSSVSERFAHVPELSNSAK